MNLKEDVSLADYSTMHLGGSVKYLLEVENEDMLKSALSWAKSQNIEVIMIGGGSNVIWKDEGFNGLLLVNLIKGFEVTDEANKFKVRIASGETWDDAVYKSVDLGLSGIEALSLIPGTAGATPIQNVGAYGQEIAQTLESVEAFDINSNQMIRLTNSECHFSYRNSIFKENPNNFYITAITLTLTKDHMKTPFYPSLDRYLKQNNINDYSPVNIRNAVIDIRNQKLPNPKDYYNCGSFFANPVLSKEKFNLLKQKTFEEIPAWEVKNGVKLSAAWLIEKAGYKNYHDPITGMSTWKNQSLVLVNDFASKTASLITFRDQIKAKVAEIFDIELIQEPLMLPY